MPSATIICDAMQAGTYEKRDVVKVIVETTAYAKALVKLEEKSPDTNYWIGAGTFVVNINGVRTYTLSSTRRIAKIEEIAVTTVVSADDKRPVTKKEGRP